MFARPGAVGGVAVRIPRIGQPLRRAHRRHLAQWMADACLVIPWTVDHDMKPRTVLKAVVLATMPLLLATPAQAAAPEPSQGLGGDGITKSFADIMDLD